MVGGDIAARQSVIVLLGALCALLPRSQASGAAPGVPNLGESPGGYVEYAVDNLPQWFRTPQLQAADNTPTNNPITDAGAELGRVLFYDARLSHNDGTSCSSCHTQETGFTDTAALSQGFEDGLTGRHSMSLANARFYQRGRFFWDERAETLEDQVLIPIQDAVEMGSDLNQLVSELQQTKYYPVLFERAFGDQQVTSERMSAALAQFVRSMASYQSEYDQALAAGTPNGPGQGRTPDFQAVDSIADPAAATRGHAIFGDSCASCHRTDAQIANAPENIALDAVDTDDGAGNGEMKVPSLRNVALRGRFMHDGRFESLAEVIDFYSDGVQPNPNRSGPIPPQGFRFSTAEQSDLIAFLETLTDSALLTDELFADPFITLEGDYNGDGEVDADDYARWRNDYGLTSDQVSGPLFADGNQDGVVDAADYSLWRDNLGNSWSLSGITASSSVSAATVPEASSLVIAVMIATSMAIVARPIPYRQRHVASDHSPYSSM